MAPAFAGGTRNSTTALLSRGMCAAMGGSTRAFEQTEDTRGHFRAPRSLQLPPLDPRFYLPGGISTPSWQRVLGSYLRSVPPLYRMAKATAALGDKVKSEATMRRHLPKRRSRIC